VSLENFVQPRTIHIGLFLDIGQVSTGGLSANNAVGLGRERGLVDRAIPKASLIFTFGISFWEDMMDVDREIKVGSDLNRITAQKIIATLFHEKGHKAFVGCT